MEWIFTSGQMHLPTFLPPNHISSPRSKAGSADFYNYDFKMCKGVDLLLAYFWKCLKLSWWREVYTYIRLRQTNKAESVQPPAVPVWQCYGQAWEQSNRLRCQPCAAKAQQKSLCRQMFGPQGQKHPRPLCPKVLALPQVPLLPTPARPPPHSTRAPNATQSHPCGAGIALLPPLPALPWALLLPYPCPLRAGGPVAQTSRPAPTCTPRQRRRRAARGAMPVPSGCVPVLGTGCASGSAWGAVCVAASS